MSITLQQVNPLGSRVFMGTITQGTAVHTGLAATAKVHNIQPAAFELLGGLHLLFFSRRNYLCITARGRSPDRDTTGQPAPSPSR